MSVKIREAIIWLKTQNKPISETFEATKLMYWSAQHHKKFLKDHRRQL